MWPELAETLYAKARIMHHVGNVHDRDEAAKAHNEALREAERVVDRPLRILDDVQNIAGLASARVVAGG